MIYKQQLWELNAKLNNNLTTAYTVTVFETAL